MFELITLENFLSFGPGAHTIPLGRLNVLIGPNGSGKSNLVEAFALLRAVPRDLPLPIRQGGGVHEWLWHNGEGSPAASAAIGLRFNAGEISPRDSAAPVHYGIRFGAEGDSFVVLDEHIGSTAGAGPYVYFGYSHDGRPFLNNASKEQRFLELADIDRTQSILSQRRDPETYPEVAIVGDRLKKILIYRAWSFGPQAPIRSACSADVPTHALAEDFSNLPARLMELKRRPALKRRLLDLLAEIAPRFSDIEIIPEGGRLQLYLTEGDRNVPARRLSDGTLRYLALLTVLLTPDSARLVIIEEPELGLHPDVLPVIRDLLIEASQHTQIIITTHSTQLVDAFTEHPECIIVCEKPEATSLLSRLDATELERWREFGSLGTLWMSGRLGGTRW